MGLSRSTTLSVSWLVQTLSLQVVFTIVATSIQHSWGASLERSHVCGDEEIPGCSLIEALAGAPWGISFLDLEPSLYIRIVILFPHNLLLYHSILNTYFPEEINCIEQSCGHWGVDEASSRGGCLIRIRCCPAGPGTQATVQVEPRESQRRPYWS